jgi:hypothetical protein
MPYVFRPERERAYWRTLPEIVDHICAVDGCDRDAARQQIRKALADNVLGPLKWEEDRRSTPLNIGGATADLDDPPPRDAGWLEAEIDWDAGTVLEFVPECQRLARRRVLLVRLQAVAHVWPDREAEEQAAEQSRAMRRDHAQREFDKLGWIKWRVYSWIAYRDRSRICAIENVGNLWGLQQYARPCVVDRKPEETLLLALQAGELKAIDGDGEEIVADYWLGKEARDIGDDMIFRRADVLRVWKESGPPSAGASADASEALGELTKPGSTIAEPPQPEAVTTAAADAQRDDTRAQPKAAPARRARKGGRNPGDGTKDDEAELEMMLRLIAENKAASPNAAAQQIIETSKAQGDKPAQHAFRRLGSKFIKRYGPKRQDREPWGVVCRRIAGELQTK